MKGKIIFITGGVYSSLGKGILTSSIAQILENLGYKINIIKIDPYLNINTSNMSPYQHGEVYVTKDGSETDLDLGNYYRFTKNVEPTAKNSITTGQIYKSVIDKEIRGEYLGETVQMIPHITNEIKKRIIEDTYKYNFTLVEVGGTIGDIESNIFIETIRQIKQELEDEILIIHLTKLFKLHNKELKTKPTQHSIQELRRLGIIPDILFCRTKKRMSKEIKEKLSLFTGINKKYILNAKNDDDIYNIPNNLYNKEKIHKKILNKFSMQTPNLILYDQEKEKFDNLCIVGILGKYTKMEDTYKSLDESIKLACKYNKTQLKLVKINADDELDNIKKQIDYCDGIIIPGGFGERSIENQIESIKYIREQNKPTIGICLGMQLMAIEFARNILELKNANSEEFDKQIYNKIFILNDTNKFILGNKKVFIDSETLAYDIYHDNSVKEIHRHKYIFNNEIVDLFDSNCFIPSGYSDEMKPITEILEYKQNKFYIGVQFHPEFKSKLNKPHPIFDKFIKNILS